MEALLTNTKSMVYTVHRQELNWVQNNSIFLDAFINLKKRNTILITVLFSNFYVNQSLARQTILQRDQQ
jgi:hypothetical protein